MGFQLFIVSTLISVITHGHIKKVYLENWANLEAEISINSCYLSRIQSIIYDLFKDLLTILSSFEIINKEDKFKHKNCHFHTKKN